MYFSLGSALLLLILSDFKLGPHLIFLPFWTWNGVVRLKSSRSLWTSKYPAACRVAITCAFVPALIDRTRFLSKSISVKLMVTVCEMLHWRILCSLYTICIRGFPPYSLKIIATDKFSFKLPRPQICSLISNLVCCWAAVFNLLSSHMELPIISSPALVAFFGNCVFMLVQSEICP